MPDATVPAPVVNGWVALDSERDIYLVRRGEDARRLDAPGSDTSRRGVSGVVAGRNATAVRPGDQFVGQRARRRRARDRPVGDGAAGAPPSSPSTGSASLGGFDPHPCGTWAPDGRWVAFGGRGEVWVVDTQTSEIRRLPNLRPIDLEWRPGTDQLAIAGEVGTNERPVSTPVTIYSVSTGELSQLGSVEAGYVTWSPDGSTLAYQGGEDDRNELWLVDGDGTNERLLVADPGEAITASAPCGPQPATASSTSAAAAGGGDGTRSSW